MSYKNCCSTLQDEREAFIVYGLIYMDSCRDAHAEFGHDF